MMLIPTNCWKAASPMPTRTTGGKPTRAQYEQVRQARLVLTAQALLDLPHQCFRVAADSSENPAGVVPPTVGNQEARRLGDEEHAGEKCDGRHGLHPEHPAPGRRTQPEGRAGSAGEPDEGVVAQE